MNFDGLFIDMYGTLTTGDKAAVEAVCREIVHDTAVRRPTGEPLTAPELAIIWGERFFADMEACNGDGFRTLFELESASLVRTMAALGVQVDPAPYVTRLSAYWRDPPLQPEVRDFLQRCAAAPATGPAAGRATRLSTLVRESSLAPRAPRPLPLCIVSNADQADLEAALHRLELQVGPGFHVAAVITSEEARSYKPHPAIFELALARTGWRRDRVVHIGDSLHSDVGGARAAGLRSAWVNRAHRIHDIGTCTPDHECTDLLDVLQCLASAP